MGADYHTKPNANVRVDAGNLAWARGEAKRRGQQFGDFMDGLIAAERDKVAGHVVDRPPVTAGDEHPQTTRTHAQTCKCLMCRPENRGSSNA